MHSPSNSQLKAIHFGSGTMLVLAGPGSGKTFVIIQRILNLILVNQIKPEHILVISFSKASTLELKQRFQKQIKEQFKITNHNEVNFATFHACFFHILKETYHYTPKDIITEKQKRELIKTVLSNPNCDEEKIEDYLQRISYYKNRDKKELKETPWGQIDKSKLRERVIEAKNFKTIAPEVFLDLREGREDGKMGALKYPVMELDDDTLYYNRGALASAKGYAEKNNEEEVLAKLKKIYEKFKDVKGGLAIFLTNDQSYLKGKENSACRKFSMNDRVCHEKDKDWTDDKSKPKKHPNHPDFKVDKNYTTDWFKVENEKTNSDFYYCILEITK